ncbi:MAG TPA: hypothetical protein VEK08_02450 [Planctomycetota bacterium]|nr:hypothetical protein [Planctomycetota bacterium]
MIVIGWSIEETPLGYAADFCPFCRRIRAFKITQLSQQTHTYFISVHESELELTMNCLSCKFSCGTKTSNYLNLEPQTSALEELIQRTHPDVRSKYKNELALAERVRGETTTSQERIAWLKEPFQLVNHLLPNHCSPLLLIKEGTMYGFCIAIVIGIVTAVVAAPISKNPDITKSLGIVSGFATGMIAVPLCLIWRFRKSRRFIVENVYPLLQIALKGSRPTLDELNAVMQSLQEFDLSIVDYIDTQYLYHLMQQEPKEEQLAAA